MTEECTYSINNKKLSTYYLRYQVAKLFEHPSYVLTMLEISCFLQKVHNFSFIHSTTPASPMKVVAWLVVSLFPTAAHRPFQCKFKDRPTHGDGPLPSFLLSFCCLPLSPPLLHTLSLPLKGSPIIPSRRSGGVL